MNLKIIPKQTISPWIVFMLFWFFTYILLSKTSNIIQQRVFTDDSFTFHYFTKEKFSKLFDNATSDIYFTFKYHVFQQLGGVAMGSPLGPTLANIFMRYQEQTWLEKCPPLFKPILPALHRRHVSFISSTRPRTFTFRLSQPTTLTN